MARLPRRGQLLALSLPPVGQADEQEYLSTPIFSPDWGADEELLLISGLITFGLGNWLEVAGYIGTRTKEECEKHYYEVFLGVGLDGRELPRKGEERKSEVKVERSGDVEMEGGEEGQKRKREFMPVCQLHHAHEYIAVPADPVADERGILGRCRRMASSQESQNRGNAETSE